MDKGIWSFWIAYNQTIGYQYESYLFRNVFTQLRSLGPSIKDSNGQLQPFPLPPNDDVFLDDASLTGSIALTTEPNYAIVDTSIGKLLLQGTAGVTFSGSAAPNNVHGPLADCSVFLPVSDRNFVLLGGALLYDVPESLQRNIFALRAGVAGELQGASATAPEKELVLEEHYSFSQSHTMARIVVEGLIVDLFSDNSPSLSDRKGYILGPYQQYRPDPKTLFSDTGAYGDHVVDKNGNKLHSFPPFYGAQQNGSYPNDSYTNDPDSTVRFQAQVDGIQPVGSGSFAYLFMVEGYPLLNKAGAAVNLSYHIYVGRALDFFLEGKVQKLWSLKPKDPLIVVQWLMNL